MRRNTYGEQINHLYNRAIIDHHYHPERGSEPMTFARLVEARLLKLLRRKVRRAGPLHILDLRVREPEGTL